MLKAYKKLKARLQVYREFIKSEHLVQEYLKFIKERKQNEKAMEKYTIEQIHYNLDVARDCLSEKFVNLVCKALSLLDKKIVDEVSDKVLFFSSDFIRETTSCHLILSSYAKTRKVIIFLSENLLEKPEQKAIKIILHEVAHFILNHKQCFDLTEIEINKQEQEAENLVLKWLEKCQTKTNFLIC